MPSATSKKLRIKDGFSLLTINAPENFKKELDDASVKFTSSSGKYNQIHWFVETKSQMEKELKNVLPLLKEDILCWIYYPKGSSKMQTDLTRDKGWELLLGNKELLWISLISFNDTWSAFAIRRVINSGKNTEAAPKEKRAIFDYIDSGTKTIRLPDDFEKELKKKKLQSSFFESLSFSNKKEYVEWIVSAKKDETRTARIKESIERLAKEWKNPSNR
jgi:hypothetical protein